MNNLKMLTISSLLMISSLFGSNHTIKHKKMIDGLNLKNMTVNPKNLLKLLKYDRIEILNFI